MKTRPNNIISTAEDVLIAAVFNSFIANGLLDPRNKTQDEIDLEFANLINENIEEMCEYRTIDHSETLLEEARKFKKASKYEIACTLYATWFEHWINFIIKTQLCRLNIADEEAIALIRDVNIKTKYGLILNLIKLPEIPKIHKQSIAKISELRNGFVHYKYKPLNMDHDPSTDFTAAIKNTEKAIKYLQNYRLKHIYYNAKRKA